MDRAINVALVHDYLVQDGGAERVLACFQEMFPEAPTYVIIHNRQRPHPVTHEENVHASFINRLPGAKRLYQLYTPFMPMAIEHLDLSAFDLVISSSSSFGKGLIVPPETLHICYCHTPTRFLWHDRFSYIHDHIRPRTLARLAYPLLHKMRLWDMVAAQRPDHLITNSRKSQERIRRYYQREAAVLHPPVETERIPVSQQTGSYWLAGGRLVAYKRFDLLLEAFKTIDAPLKIFGNGPEASRLKKMAPSNVELLGHIDDATKFDLYAGCKGFLHPQLEDFGITAVEAMAAGKPVIAYGKGGGAETVIDGVTGIHLQTQTPEEIRQVIQNFDAHAFNPQHIRTQAERFSKDRFIQEFRQVIDTALHAHASRY